MREEVGAGAERRWAVLAVLCGVLVMAGSDFTKVSVAAPRIADGLGTSPTAELWLVDLYALAAGALLVSAAAGVERFGRKRVYLAGLALYGAASMAGAVAHSTAVLLVARVGLGIGSALLIAATVAIIRVSFALAHQRAIAYGAWTASFSVGSAVGPLVGGLVVEVLSWRWVFAINLPVIAVAAVAAALVMTETRNPDPPPVDPLSLVTSVTALSSLVVVVKYGPTGQMPPPLAGVLIAVAVVVAAVFLSRQRRLARPFLDLELLRQRPLALAASTIAVSNGVFSATLYLLTVQFQRVEGLSAIDAGVAVVPLAAASAVGGLAAPRLSAVISRRSTITAGLISSGLGLSALLMPPVPVAWAMALIGLGAGAVMTLGADTVMRSAPLERTGDAGAIQESAFALGAGFGVAILGTIAVVGSNDGSAPQLGLNWAYGIAAATVVATALAFFTRYVEGHHELSLPVHEARANT
jgi:DHA2 family multidrug resistance protein-like MFS transporter